MQENHTNNPEELERFQDERVLNKKSATQDQLDEEIKEREYEKRLGQRKIEDLADIERLTTEANNLAQKKPDETIEKKSISPVVKKNQVRGLRRLAMALGFAMAGLTGQAATTHSENYGDSTKTEKITQVENHQEVNGINLEGMVAVPMEDTTANYYFLGFSGNPQDHEKIEKMKEAVKKLGYDLASSQELKLALEKHGQKLIKATGGYGISLKDIGLKVDDTQNPIINNVVEGPVTHILTTFNPLGQINRYEIEAIEKNGIQYSDYPVFVKQVKEKQQTVDYQSALNK